MQANELNKTTSIDLLDSSDISKIFHTSENAVRIHMHRRSGAIPQGFKVGRKWFWSRRKIEAWLELKA